MTTIHWGTTTGMAVYRALLAAPVATLAWIFRAGRLPFRVELADHDRNILFGLCLYVLLALVLKSLTLHGAV